MQDKKLKERFTVSSHESDSQRAEAFQLKNKNVWFGKINSENNMEDDWDWWRLLLDIKPETPNFVNGWQVFESDMYKIASSFQAGYVYIRVFHMWNFAKTKNSQPST